MRKQNFNEFKIWCSDIHSLFVRPQGYKHPNKTEIKKYDRIINQEEEKDEDDLLFLQSFDDKLARYNDPPLSKTIISNLINRYGWLTYNKKTASTDRCFSFLKKGNELELEAVDLLSKFDKIKYSRNENPLSNEYLWGRCDIICEQKNKIVDTKISWNVNSFLRARTTPLSKKYWFQAQGYMELYDKDTAEVAFLLLNTPADLIEKERVKLANRFMTGEIDRDKYELGIENLESAFTYSNVPIKRRVFKYIVNRNRDIFETVYKKVEKARIWLNEFDQELTSNIFLVSSDNYLKSEENITESDTPERDPLE